LTKRQ